MVEAAIFINENPYFKEMVGLFPKLGDVIKGKICHMYGTVWKAVKLPYDLYCVK